MQQKPRFALLPFGSIVDRYIASGFVRVFVASLLCFTAIFAIIWNFRYHGTSLRVVQNSVINISGDRFCHIIFDSLLPRNAL